MHTLHRLVARNTHTDSENRIHADDVAQQHGFRGGLVPGVTTWAYMVRPPVAAFGLPWVERGTMAVRLVKPVYDGDAVEIGGADMGGTGLELTTTNAEGVVCAEGTAGLPARAAAPPDPAGHPRGPIPDERPPASEATLAVGTVLGTIDVGFHADRAAAFLDEIGDDHPIWRDEGIGHPGWLMLFANWVLTRSVQLGPWIHFASEAHHFGLVRDGARVEVRARVAGLGERRGNRSVDLDVLYLADGTPVMSVRHHALWQLARRDGQGSAEDS